MFGVGDLGLPGVYTSVRNCDFLCTPCTWGRAAKIQPWPDTRVVSAVESWSYTTAPCGGLVYPGSTRDYN